MSDKLEYDVVASIVLYKHSKEEILQVAKDFFDSSTGLRRKLCLIDNSPEKSDYSNEENDILEYHHTNHNGGYGYGHNKAIHANQGNTKYHVVLNPDIQIKDNVINKLFKEMEANKNIGLCSPQINNADGTNQFQSRRLPKFSYILKRGTEAFFPKSKKFFQKENDEENLKSLYDKKKAFVAPFISGCFMFMRGTHLNKVKGFDEKYFMYYEDYDLSRRLAEKGKNVVFPQHSITHDWQRSSTKSLKLLKAHATSMMRYFSKYGFIKDKTRDKINKEVKTYKSKLESVKFSKAKLHTNENNKELNIKTTDNKNLKQENTKYVENTQPLKRVNER